MKMEEIISSVILTLLLLNIPAGIKAQDKNELSLQIAIALAQESNPQLMALDEEIVSAKGRGWTTWWLTDPTLSIEWEGVPKGASLNEFSERNLTFTQEFEFPTNVLWRYRFAAREVDATRMRYEQGQLRIRAAVIDTYTRFLARRDGVVLAKERVRLAQEFIDRAEIRLRVGEAPAIETVRARIEYAQAQNELYNIESKYKAAQTRLNAILGRQPDKAIIATDSLVYQEVDLSLAALKQKALVEHPRLGEANALVASASNLRNLAWGSFLPAIEVSAFQQSIGANPNYYGMEVELKLPLWFALRQRGEIQEASASLAAQENQRTGTQLQLLSEIESAYAAFEASRLQVENYTTSLLDQANEVYRIALRSYEEGEIGYLHLLEAQQTLVEVRHYYINTLANYYTAVAAVEEASGVIIIR